MRRAPRLIHEVQRLGLTVSIAALLIVLLVVFRLVWSVAVTAPADQRLQDGLLALEDSHQAMLDMDASLRGYLATGERFFADRATDGAGPVHRPARARHPVLTPAGAARGAVIGAAASSVAARS